MVQAIAITMAMVQTVTAALTEKKRKKKTTTKLRQQFKIIQKNDDVTCTFHLEYKKWLRLVVMYKFDDNQLYSDGTH